VFSTASDNQPSVEIHILQGERPMANQNRTIGRFHLDGIPPAPRGVPQVEVTFDIDANGILHVSAKDKATGKEQKIRIEASSGLTDEEIKKMKTEAEANAEADRKAKEEVEKLNAADALIFSTEKQLKEYGDKISADKKAPIESALKRLKDAYATKNLTDIEAAQTELNNAWTAASEEMYKASADGQQGQPGAGADHGAAGNNGQQNSSDTVTDVDFEEVK
jgi:molecular chaperone DnaK